jgi:hypothetical protein
MYFEGEDYFQAKATFSAAHEGLVLDDIENRPDADARYHKVRDFVSHCLTIADSTLHITTSYSS